MPPAPAQDSRHVDPSVIASPREARAKQSRSGVATMYASRSSRAAPSAWIASAASRPRNDGERAVPPAPARHVLHRRPTVIASPRDNFSPSLRARAERGRSNPEAARQHGTPPARNSRRRRPSVIASASEASAKQSQKRRGHNVGLPPIYVLHRPPGLLRPLRGLAMTGMDAPPRHDGSRHDGGRAVPSPSGRDHGAGQCETPGGGPPGVCEVETVRRPACRVRPSPHAGKGRKRAGQG